MRLRSRYGRALLGCALVFMAGCAAEVYRSADVVSPAQETSSRGKLGTQWGEGISSSVTNVNLRRLSPHAVDVVVVHYSSANYQGQPVREAMLANGRIGFSIPGDRHTWEFTQDGRNLYLSGKEGERYQLSYRNYSDNTYEIVATVDGLDILDGSPGALSHRGYVLYPRTTLQIEGFRKSQDEVAAFRFSAPRDAYAANTDAGSPDNVGVIGTAVFELDVPRAPRPSPYSPQAFPEDAPGSYAPPPQYRR
ncbi:MAG: hypothetical protein LBB76_02000 [Azoarcus sp.]|nr:hypothetical protein [Azoarcus sp.]